jgi:hypothetical protein
MTSKLFERKVNNTKSLSDDETLISFSPLFASVMAQVISLLPSLLEPVLGQKLPPVLSGGEVAELRTALQNFGTKLQKVLDQQDTIGDTLIKMQNELSEIKNNSTSSSQRLSNIDNKFQNIRLTRQRETQTAEYNSPTNLQNLE